MDPPTNPPHVLLFPFPAQGHVNSMLKLAELLCLAGINVTFVLSSNIHIRLVWYTDIQSRFCKYTGFHLETLPDGVYEEYSPNTGDRILKLYNSLHLVAKPFLKKLLAPPDHDHPPITSIIIDWMISVALDVAQETNVPVINFRPASACAFWAFFCIPELIQAGELPFPGNDLDMQIENVKGMEDFLRRRDLPSFFRGSDITTSQFLNMVSGEAKRAPQAQGLILNTFEDLEGPILNHIRTHCPNLYTIGPLHAHLKTRLPESKSAFFSNSLWKEDKSCIKWLDEQPSKSVIYVSFGSLGMLTRDQLLEFWHGLVNSGTRFLWVIRPDSVTGKDGESKISKELEEATKARGYMVGWAPQEEVLAHQAVGGFLTHSGWNSTLESSFEGVPMICWPYFADQQINSRFLEQVWKLGLDMKDTCDRVIIEKMIRDLMEVRRDEFMQRAEELAQLAKNAIKESGSSFRNLDRLIEDIRLMSMPSKNS